MSTDDKSVLLCAGCLEFLSETCHLDIRRAAEGHCADYYSRGRCHRTVLCSRCKDPATENCPLRLTRAIVVNHLEVKDDTLLVSEEKP